MGKDQRNRRRITGNGMTHWRRKGTNGKENIISLHSFVPSSAQRMGGGTKRMNVVVINGMVTRSIRKEIVVTRKSTSCVSLDVLIKRLRRDACSDQENQYSRVQCWLLNRPAVRDCRRIG